MNTDTNNPFYLYAPVQQYTIINSNVFTKNILIYERLHIDFPRRILCDCKQITESESEYTNLKKEKSLYWFRENYQFFATKEVRSRKATKKEGLWN